LNCTTANFCCTGKSILVIDGNSRDGEIPKTSLFC